MRDLYIPAVTDAYMRQVLGQTPEQRAANIDAAVERNIARWAGRSDLRPADPPKTPTSHAGASWREEQSEAVGEIIQAS